MSLAEFDPNSKRIYGKYSVSGKIIHKEKVKMGISVSAKIFYGLIFTDEYENAEELGINKILEDKGCNNVTVESYGYEGECAALVIKSSIMTAYDDAKSIKPKDLISSPNWNQKLKEAKEILKLSEDDFLQEPPKWYLVSELF